MTERLSTLLAEETVHLDIPAPDAAGVLAQGRRLHRRRRTTTAVAGSLAVAVVVAGALALGGPGVDDSARVVPVDEPAPYADGGAFAVGTDVYFGDGDAPITDVGEPVKALYYTSAGVVVRTGDEAATDSAGSSHYRLVTGAGQSRDLGIDLGDRVPGTDPEQPLLAWAEQAGGGWDVVVLDVRDGSEVARVPVPDSFTWGGWEGPPVALSGDFVHVGVDDATIDVQWRTGEAHPSVTLPRSTMPSVNGGRAVVEDRGTDEVTVVDVRSGEVLMSLPRDRSPMVSLSPDGRYAKVMFFGRAMSTQETFTVREVGTDRETKVAGAGWDYGWTADGHLMTVGDDEVTVCPPLGGDCTSTPVDVGKAEVRMAGLSYES